MPLDLAHVAGLPGFAGRFGGELLAEAGEQVDQLAAPGPGAGQGRQSGEVDEPLRIYDAQSSPAPSTIRKTWW